MKVSNLKLFILIICFLLTGCGAGEQKEHSACVSVEVQRAICFTDMMEVYAYSEAMIPYAQDYCAEVYPVPMCYLPDTNWHN